MEYIARFVAGGLLVCLFALISQVCEPKQFAGLFSAAPSVLLAGLALTLVLRGTPAAVLTAQGAIAGAVGMVGYCLLASRFLRRFPVLPGSVMALLAWFVLAFGSFAIGYLVLHW